MNIIRNFLDFSGLSYIPYAIGLFKFQPNPSISERKIRLIKKRIKEIRKNEAREILLYCEQMFKSEMARGEKAESKASSLIGITGVSAAFVTGVTKIFPEQSLEIFPNQNLYFLLIYILIVISLTLTILLASRVVIVGGYKFSYPDSIDVFNLDDRSSLDLTKEKINDYLVSYIVNSKIHNTKFSYLIGSQIWFRNTIFLFLILAFISSIVIYLDTSLTYKVFEFVKSII